MFLADGNCIKVQEGWGVRQDEQNEGAKLCSSKKEWTFHPLGNVLMTDDIVIVHRVMCIYLVDCCAMSITLNMVCNCLTLSSSQCQLLKIARRSVFLPGEIMLRRALFSSQNPPPCFMLFLALEAWWWLFTCTLHIMYFYFSRPCPTSYLFLVELPGGVSVSIMMPLAPESAQGESGWTVVYPTSLAGKTTEVRNMFRWWLEPVNK